MTTFIEARLANFVEHVREDAPSSGTYTLPDSDRVPNGDSAIVVGLARFQSYRARTQTALVQELLDWVEYENIGVIHFEVRPDDTVILW